jgi:hypothetical protein
MAYGCNDNEDLDAASALRQGSYSKYGKDYTLLRKAMTKGRAEEAKICRHKDERECNIGRNDRRLDI